MKWNFDTYGKLELVEGKGKEAGSLILIKVDAKSDPNFSFGGDELDKLWQTMVNSDMPIRDPALVMFSADVNPDGFPRFALEAETMTPEKAGRSYNAIWGAWQLKEYKPTNFEMHVKLKRPSLWAFCDGFKTGSVSNAAPRAKLTFASAKEAPKAQPAQAPRGNGPRRQG